MSNKYNNESIKSLSDREAVRLRPANILGSDGVEGCFHCLIEIFDNAIDEAKGGHGDEITIKRFKDGSYSVQDKGRGVPMDFNKSEDKFNYELIFGTLYAGGKYSSDENDSYAFSKGLNGLGSASSAFASEFFNVQSVRDGYKYAINMIEGEFIGKLSKEKSSDSTGTLIHWKPDNKVFVDVEIPFDWILKLAKEQSVVNKGITMIVEDEESDKTFSYFYENGIRDYIDELSEGKNMTDVLYLESETTGKDREDMPEYRSKYEIAITFNNDVNALESYHNSSYLKHGGSPHEAVKSAFVWSIDRLIKSKNQYKKDEKKITFEDIQESLLIITNTYSTETSYQNQTKFAITNKFIRDYMNSYLREQLEIYFIENPLDAEKIMMQVLANSRARESAEKTRLNIKKKLSGNINNIDNRIDGFIPCRSKNKDETELIIVEGKSALGSTKQGRDARTQAIIALRGKILNCLKADYDRIFKNEIIVDLVKLLGCGVEIKSKHNKDISNFDIDNLRWNKVIIATDQDIDGMHIRTLILTLIYRLMPTLIKEEKVFIVESPLYEIESESGTVFAYDDKEKDEIVSNLTGKITIQRSKGLGENTADMMWDTTMNPETRRLIKITPEDEAKTQRIFEMFLGDDLEGRKEYIENNLHKYVEEAINQ